MSTTTTTSRGKGSRLVMLPVVLLVFGLLLAPPAATATGSDTSDAAGDGKVLLLSVPGLTWADVADHDLPVLEGFLDGAAVANHAPRGVSATSPPGAAYLTISAGARAAGQPTVDGRLLDLQDSSAGYPAGEIFERRTGAGADGEYVALDWPALLRRNAAEPYDTELGLLAEALEDEGLGASVVANADGTDTVADSYERQAGLAVVKPDGVVPSGDLGVEPLAGSAGDDLVVQDAPRPFGRRLNPDRVVERFGEYWAAPGGEAGGLVLVEASDLARTMRYRDRVDRARYDELWEQSLTEADQLIGELLAEVDLERDTVLLLAPYNLPGDRDLTVAALRTPTEGAGYLRSASTQRRGFVTLVDVAPTVLDLLGVDRHTAMEGRPFEVAPSADTLDERVDEMVSENRSARFREGILVPTTLVVVVAFALVGALAIVSLARPSGLGQALGTVVTGGALFTLALLPMSFLVRLFPMEEWGLAFYWAFLLAGALVVAVMATGVGKLLGRPRLPLVAVLILTVAVPTYDVMTGSWLSVSAAFGYSATGNSRLYGISNYALGAFGASASLLAALVASRGRGTSRGNRIAAGGLMLAALAVIGVPVWGANVGGILSFSPVVVLFAAVLLGSRLRLRALLVGFAIVTAAAVSLFAALDLARPPERRSHLGRLVERISDDGSGPLFSIMERKGVAAVEVTLTSFWTAAVLVAIVVWLTLWWLPDRPLEAVRERIPLLNAGLVAAVAAAAFGSVMNDSGSIVGGTALLVVGVALICLTHEPVPAGRLVPGGAEAVAVVEPSDDESGHDPVDHDLGADEDLADDDELGDDHDNTEEEQVESPA